MGKMPERGYLLNERESTGIAGLDEVIGGGLARPSLTALIGAPGTGTTTFCKQFIMSSLQRERNVMVACTDEPVGHFLRHFRFPQPFDLEPYVRQNRLVILDMYERFTERLGIKSYSNIEEVGEIPLGEILEELTERVASGVPGLPREFNTVIDSLTAVAPFVGVRDMYAVLRESRRRVREGKHVVVLTAHEGALEGNIIQALRQHADCVIKMTMSLSKTDLKRLMIIEKAGFTEIKQATLEFSIGSAGIEIKQ